MLCQVDPNTDFAPLVQNLNDNDPAWKDVCLKAIAANAVLRKRCTKTYQAALREREVIELGKIIRDQQREFDRLCYTDGDDEDDLDDGD